VMIHRRPEGCEMVLSNLGVQCGVLVMRMMRTVKANTFMTSVII
jgi:hypothetical protein